MARQKGIIKLKGTIGDITFYKSKDGYIAREKGGIDANIIGEIAFRKHIKEIQLHQMPIEPISLLSLIELPEYIAYLYQINSRRRTRQI